MGEVYRARWLPDFCRDIGTHEIYALNVRWL
jgi:hypothetical protein